MTRRRDQVNNRVKYNFRLNDDACMSIKENLPSRFKDSFSALVEELLVNYSNALSYYTESKPAWDRIIQYYPDNIAPIAKKYHPSLHYQFASPELHSNTKHGYYLRLRSFSIINAQPSLSAELFIPDAPPTPLQNLHVHDIAPIYLVADFANI